MDELISRRAIIAEYDRVHVGAPGGARKLIEEAPTIDAVPVRHGRWEERPVNVGTCTTGLFCSECNFPSLGWRYNYCPNCGAKMDGDI